jgi:hypothetical protein
MKSTKKMFTYRVEKEQHETLKKLAQQLNKKKTLKFPIVSASQLKKIELIEFEKDVIFTGFSSIEALNFINENK